MDKAEIMLYLHNHKSEDSDTILLVFENTRAMNHWKQMNGISSGTTIMNNYEWISLDCWMSVIGRKFKEYRMM